MSSISALLGSLLISLTTFAGYPGADKMFWLGKPNMASQEMVDKSLEVVPFERVVSRSRPQDDGKVMLLGEEPKPTWIRDGISCEAGERMGVDASYFTRSNVVICLNEKNQINRYFIDAFESKYYTSGVVSRENGVAVSLNIHNSFDTDSKNDILVDYTPFLTKVLYKRTGATCEFYPAVVSGFGISTFEPSLSRNEYVKNYVGKDFIVPLPSDIEVRMKTKNLNCPLGSEIKYNKYSTNILCILGGKVVREFDSNWMKLTVDYEYTNGKVSTVTSVDNHSEPITETKITKLGSAGFEKFSFENEILREMCRSKYYQE